VGYCRFFIAGYFRWICPIVWISAQYIGTVLMDVGRVQSVRDRLEARRSTVEASARQGRMCRADQHDDDDDDTGAQLPGLTPADI